MKELLSHSRKHFKLPPTSENKIELTVSSVNLVIELLGRIHKIRILI